MYLLRYSTRPVVHLAGQSEVEIRYAGLEEAVDSAVAALNADPSIFVAIAELSGPIVCSVSELRRFADHRRLAG